MDQWNQKLKRKQINLGKQIRTWQGKIIRTLSISGLGLGQTLQTVLRIYELSSLLEVSGPSAPGFVQRLHLPVLLTIFSATWCRAQILNFHCFSLHPTKLAWNKLLQLGQLASYHMRDKLFTKIASIDHDIAKLGRLDQLLESMLSGQRF